VHKNSHDTSFQNSNFKVFKVLENPCPRNYLLCGGAKRGKNRENKKKKKKKKKKIKKNKQLCRERIMPGIEKNANPFSNKASMESQSFSYSLPTGNPRCCEF